MRPTRAEMSQAMAQGERERFTTRPDRPGAQTRVDERNGVTSLREKSVDELLLAYRRDGDRAARDEALVRLMPLVRSLAARYAGRGEPLEDLVQVGAIGLIKAVDRFDPSRGVEFTSYGVPTVVGEIRRHFRDKAWAMHVPRRVKELSVRLTRVLDELTTTLGRSPTIAELAEAASAHEEDVIDALDAAHAFSTRSLDAAPGGGEQFGERLADTDPGYDGVHDRWVLAAGLDALDPRARRIVELRFFEEKTQSQIAAELGISQMHVSRLLRSAFEVMRSSIEESGRDG